MRVRPLPTKHHILEAYALMATKNKNDIETALNNLVSLASKDPDSVPVLLAMAMAFHLLKQMPKVTARRLWCMQVCRNNSGESLSVFDVGSGLTVGVAVPAQTTPA